MKKIRKGPELGFAPLNVTLHVIVNAHLGATEPQGAMEPNSTCSASTGRGVSIRFSTVYVYQLGGEKYALRKNASCVYYIAHPFHVH